MDTNLCPVGYVNQTSSKAKLQCGFKVGTQCLVGWIESKAMVGFIPTFNNKFERGSMESEYIPGINAECEKRLEGNIGQDESGEGHHTLGYKEGFKFLEVSQNQESLEKFSLGMLNLISINGKDYRKGPKIGCDYIGTLDLKPSRQMLSCEKGGFEWSDPALYPFCKKFYIKFQNFFSYNSDTANNLQKVIKGEPCPSCGICIIKLDGCSHMVGGKGNYEFGWDCLGHYPNYNHTEFNFGPIRKLIIYIFMFFFLIESINTKIGLLSDTVTNIESVVGEWIVFLIVTNVYAASAFLFFGLYNEATSNYRLMVAFPEYQAVYRKNFIYFTLCSIAYPIGYISISVMLFFTSEYYISMVNGIAVEAMIAVIGVLFFVIFYCLVSLWRGVFGQRQALYQPISDVVSDQYDWRGEPEEYVKLEEPLIPSYEEYKEETKGPEDIPDYEGLPERPRETLELMNIGKEIRINTNYNPRIMMQENPPRNAALVIVETI